MKEQTRRVTQPRSKSQNAACTPAFEIGGIFARFFTLGRVFHRFSIPPKDVHIYVHL